MVSAISGDTVCTDVVSAISGDAVCTDVISTISSDTVCTDVVSAVSSNMSSASVSRTIFCKSGKSESTAGQYRERQAKDKF